MQLISAMILYAASSPCNAGLVESHLPPDKPHGTETLLPGVLVQHTKPLNPNPTRTAGSRHLSNAPAAISSWQALLLMLLPRLLAKKTIRLSFCVLSGSAPDPEARLCLIVKEGQMPETSMACLVPITQSSKQVIKLLMLETYDQALPSVVT